MNHQAALIEVAAWRLIVDDTTSKTVDRRAVRALVAAAELLAAELETRENDLRDQIVVNIDLAANVRNHAPRPERAPKTFVNDSDAIDDARRRGNCSVFREDLLQRPWVFRTTVATYWSVPIEVAYTDGILRDRWRSMTPVELDPAVPLIRPPSPDVPAPPVELPRRAG